MKTCVYCQSEIEVNSEEKDFVLIVVIKSSIKIESIMN
jgi:hypothetical protein